MTCARLRGRFVTAKQANPLPCNRCKHSRASDGHIMVCLLPNELLCESHTSVIQYIATPHEAAAVETFPR